MNTFLVTGSTNGLGLEIAKELAKNNEDKVVMAVRNTDKGMEVARNLGENVQVRKLDLSCLAQVNAFIQNWDIPLDGLINNAGVQHVNGTQFTPDGYEETIAVNHLAAFMLTMGLMPWLSGGRVLFIGSGTHNPNHTMARLSGFRGAKYSSLEDLLQGKSVAGESRQANLDRYATSKLLNTISAVELSRRTKAFSSYVLDPGMMPGTGLARHHNALVRLLWKTLLPVAGRILPDTSTPSNSAKTAAWLMTASPLPFQSGEIVSYNRKPNQYVWEDVVMNKKIGKEVYEESLKVLERYLVK